MKYLLNNSLMYRKSQKREGIFLTVDNSKNLKFENSVQKLKLMRNFDELVLGT